MFHATCNNLFIDSLMHRVTRVIFHNADVSLLQRYLRGTLEHSKSVLTYLWGCGVGGSSWGWRFD